MPEKTRRVQTKHSIVKAFAYQSYAYVKLTRGKPRWQKKKSVSETQVCGSGEPEEQRWMKLFRIPKMAFGRVIPGTRVCCGFYLCLELISKKATPKRGYKQLPAPAS